MRSLRSGASARPPPPPLCLVVAARPRDERDLLRFVAMSSRPSRAWSRGHRPRGRSQPKERSVPILTVAHDAVHDREQHVVGRAAVDDGRRRGRRRRAGRSRRRDDREVGAQPGHEAADAVVEAERDGGAAGREVERVGGAEGVRAALAGARRGDGGAELGEVVEVERRRRAVGADADADAGRAQRHERRGAAAELRVRAGGSAPRRRRSRRARRSRRRRPGRSGRRSSARRGCRRGRGARPGARRARVRDAAPVERRGELAAAVGQRRDLGGGLGEVGRERQAALGGERVHRRVELGRDRVRRVRRHTELDEAAGGRRGGVERALEPREPGRRIAGAERLEVDDRAQPGCPGGLDGGAGVRAVGDGRDARAHALEGAEGGARGDRVGLERRLAADEPAEPRREGAAVAEATVGAVLEVRVGVHEPRHDRAAGERRELGVWRGGPQRGARPDGGDRAVANEHGPVGKRRARDGQDPVRRDEQAHVVPTASGSGRGSAMRARMIESS